MSDEFDNHNEENTDRTIVPVKNNQKKLNKSGLMVLFVILAVAILTGAFAVLQSLSGTGKAKTDTIPNPEITPDLPENTFAQISKNKFPFFFGRGVKDYIAVVHIEGVIEDRNRTYNQSWLLSTIDDLRQDNKNRAIMLYIDSPGGGVYQADEVYVALQKYRTTGKPVYAYLGPLAASGGYYIACAAENISANRNTLTGSIGVIAGQSVDITGLMEKIGVKSVTITAGKNKNMMNFNAPLTDEQRAIMQSVADEAYDQFTGIVAVNRKIPLEKVKALADGRIYTARQALDTDLIDSVCSWEDAVTRLEKEKLNGENYDIEQFRVEEKTSLYDYMTGAVSAIRNLTAISKNNILQQVISNIFTPAIPFPAYYYHR
jgi:protease IV